MSSYISKVGEEAKGNWPHILKSLGISVPDDARKQAPCPACGGKDRFRFDDQQGRGTWFCNHCIPKAGDGLDLVKKTKCCSTTEAAKLVAETLQIKQTYKNAVITTSHAEPSVAIKQQIIKMMKPANVRTHDYFLKKGYLHALVHVLPDGKAIIPLVTLDGEITGAQTIDPNGNKRLVRGTKKNGAFMLLGAMKKNPEVVIITEGYATALTVSLAHDGLILAAVDAGNLINVANNVRAKWPTAKIIIAADNDISNDGSRNTGKEEAEKAAKAVFGWVALPPTNFKADWDDYCRQFGIDETTRVFTESLYMPEGHIMPLKNNKPIIKKEDENALNLSQMGASQRGEVLLNRYNGDLVLDGASDTVHFYDGVAWRPVTDRDLMREMAAAFIESDTPYTPVGVRSAVDALKLQLTLMNKPARHLIGFKNGVFDLEKGLFRPHQKTDWLLIASEVTFTHAAEDESLVTHAPNFWQWISRAAANDQRKIERILAALFMVLANRYDWQLFLEITGAGGSGKSILAEICTLLAGKGNTVSASMAALENPRDRALVVGYSLIIMPDQTRYVGDGSGIKAITGGDEVSIDPKHKQPYSTRIPAVVIAVNNNAMSFSDRSGGVSRRRVIFNFSEVIPEKERDINLRDKIAGELPVIIRHLLKRFMVASEAKSLLIEQRESEESLCVKRGTDSLVDFCGYLFASIECDGMLMGNAEIIPFNPRKYLYHSYLAFMKGNNLAKPVSLTRFGTDLKGAMAEYGKEYLRKKTKNGIRTNLDLNTENANEWLPKADGLDLPE